MSDLYFNALQEQLTNIRGLSIACVRKKPVMLYDFHQRKIYAYPYKEFKADWGERPEALLETDYKSASASGGMVVFVRDNIELKLVSYVMNVEAEAIQ